MQPKPQIIQIPVYQQGNPIEEVKRKYGLTEVIKLASNENPFGASPKALEAIQGELANIQLYPDGSARDLTAAIAEHYNVNSEQIILGCGSDELIALIARAFFVPGDETVMADQTFPVYKSNADIEGAVSIQVPLVQGTHDLHTMLAAINDKTKIVWICNPNNPTGTMNPEEELVEFLNQVPDHVLVILDEAYAEYVTESSYPSSIDLLVKHRNVVILRTFSKIYGLASLRIGYGIGHPEVIRLINQVREPFNTNRLAQAAALAALGDQNFIEECKLRNTEGIGYLNEQFDRLGLTYFPTQGNFIMVDVGIPAADMFQSLLKHGIIVRGGFTKYPTSVRITVGTQEQNHKLIEALEQVLQEA